MKVDIFQVELIKILSAKFQLCESFLFKLINIILTFIPRFFNAFKPICK